MYFDALTAAAVAHELRAKAVGGRVQAVLQMDPLSVAFEVYAHRQRLYLIASAHPQFNRVHLTATKPRRGVDKPSPLLLLLRKYVRGAQLVAVEPVRRTDGQPAFERALHLAFDGDQGPTTLVCEIMGRLANVILLDAGGVVLDAIKRVTPEMTRVRVVLPNHPYVPPPPQDRPAPVGLTAGRLRQLLAGVPADEPLWRALMRGLRALSPLAAREVAFRALGDSAAPCSAIGDAAAVVQALNELFAPLYDGAWKPSIVRQDDNVEAFAAYRLTHYGDWEPVESISAAVEAYFASLAGSDPYQTAKDQVRQVIAQARERLKRKREALERSQVSEEEVERLRACGELILGYAHEIEPGQTLLKAAYSPDEPPLSIQLDPTLTPVENSKRYFREYDKAKGALREVPVRLNQVAAELAYLEQLETDLDLAESQPEIAQVRAALAEAGYLRVPRRRPSPPRLRPLRLESSHGFVVLVGRNARQNEEVTFQHGAADDLWLHARGVPGAHVLIKTDGRPVPEETIRFAASLAAYYSRARTSSRVAVDVTQRRHVRRVRRGRPGMVTYSHESTVFVKPADPKGLQDL